LEALVNLTINRQQAGASYSPLAARFALAEPIGKLNLNLTSIQDSVALPGNSADSVSAGISLDDFLSMLADNLTRLQEETGAAKKIEPLLSAFASAISQLAEAYGQAVADRAVTAIAQGIEQGGASEANMTRVLGNVFNEIALDSTLKGKHMELTQKMTGRTPGEDDNNFADGLIRMLNSGLNFYAPGQPGLAKALGDFYLTPPQDDDDIVSNKRFSPAWSSADQAFGLKLVTDKQKVVTPESADRAYLAYGSLYFPEAHDFSENVLGYKPEWYAARMQAGFMATINYDRHQIEQRKFIVETTYGIVSGRIEYTPTEKMRERVDLFIEYREYYNTYQADSNKYWEPGKAGSTFKEGVVGVEYESVFLTHLSQEEKDAYKELMDSHAEKLKEYGRKFDELYAQALEEFLNR
jgi:hypothetical protein